MKRTMLVIFFCSLACLLHETSAQQNWWERLPDGSATISSSRTPTSTTTTTSAPASTTTNCGCLSTLEYNPVCGNNKITYDNLGKLECARNCGASVELLFYGRCEKAA